LVHLFIFVISYSKFIGWEIEGREYVAAGGDQTFLVVVVGRSLWTIDWCTNPLSIVVYKCPS